MSNFKKEDLILDSKIYVYCHKSESIKPVVIKSINAEYNFHDNNNKYQHDNVIFVNCYGAKITFISEGNIQGEFFIDFSHKFNEIGSNYVGFKTKEDAEFYEKKLIEKEIKEKELEIEQLKTKLKK